MAAHDKRCGRAVFCALAAAWIGGGMGSAAARGAFVVSIQSEQVGTGVNAGLTDFVLAAKNVGPETGTTLIGVDVAITTPGTETAGALFIDTRADFDGDNQIDADVGGLPDRTLGTPTPTLGGPHGFLGTFVGIPLSPDGNVAATSENGLNIAAVWDNGHGEAQSPPGSRNFANYASNQGPIDPAFLAGAVHSLEVQTAFASAMFKGPDASANPVPFANIVVPTGTPWRSVGLIAGNLGPVESFTVSVPEPLGVGVWVLGGMIAAVRRRARSR